MFAGPFRGPKGHHARERLGGRRALVVEPGPQLGRKVGVEKPHTHARPGQRPVITGALNAITGLDVAKQRYQDLRLSFLRR